MGLTRRPLLLTAVRWLAVVLILRVTAAILANYPDYFPPNFESLFLQGREATFHGLYRAAFYVHVLTAPLVLVIGLFLVLDSGRRRGLHRALGRVQVGVLLLVVLPSSAVMSRHAFGGWPAGLSFFTLSVVTAGCAVLGVVAARRKQYARHRRWMLRTFVLLCSAIVLRLISGAAGEVGVPYPEQAYVAAAWASWVLPLAATEVFLRRPAFLNSPAAPAAIRGGPS